MSLENKIDWTKIFKDDVEVLESSLHFRCRSCKGLSTFLPKKCHRCGYSDFDRFADVKIKMPNSPEDLNIVWPPDRNCDD